MACTSPVRFSGLRQGWHTFRVRAMDARTGELSALATYRWLVDSRQPTVRLVFPANRGSYDTTSWDAGCVRGAGLCGHAKARSGVRSVAVSIRQGATGKWWSGHSFDRSRELFITAKGTTSWRYALAVSALDGPYTVHVRATNRLGRKTIARPKLARKPTARKVKHKVARRASYDATATFTIMAPRRPQGTAEPSNPSAGAAPSFSFSGGSNSRYRCRLDSGPIIACTSPYTLSGLADGPHTLTVWAVQGASTGPATTYTWTTNTSAPTITAEPGDDSANTSQSFSFSHTESSYTFQCQLDSGGYSACTSPQSYMGLADGPHTFQVRALSADGATTTVASDTWTIDTAAPTLTAEPTDPSADVSPSFSFSDTESGYSFQCQLDSGGYSACTSPQSYGPLSDGSHTFTVQAVDGDGIATAAASSTWTLFTTPPGQSVALAPGAADAFLNGSTLFYNDIAGSSFALTDTVTTAGPVTTPASAAFPDTATTGWTHPAETVATPAGGPYTSSTFTATTGATPPTGYTITATDTLGLSSPAPLTFVDDTSPPTGAALSVNGTTASGGGSTSTSTSTSFPIDSRSDYAETPSATQSGLQSSTLTVQSETLTGSTCGAPGSGGPFTSPTTITGTTQPVGITYGSCYLYTLTGTDNVANTATISTTVQLSVPPGTLTPAPQTGSNANTGSGPSGVAFSPSGGLLATSNQYSNTVSVFTIDATTGALTPVTQTGSNASTGLQPVSVAFSPIGGLLATVNYQSGSVTVFKVNASGVLTAVTQTGSNASTHAGSTPWSVAFSPNGTLLATANGGSATVSVFTVNTSTGALTPVTQTGSNANTGTQPFSVAFSPNGGLLTASNFLGNTVSVFTVNGSGALTPVTQTGSNAATGTQPNSVAFSPNGGLLATTNGTSKTVSVFTVNGSGALTPVTQTGSNANTGTGPEGMAFSPSEALLATANSTSSTVSVFAVNGSGALTPVPQTGSNANTGSGPSGLAFSPGGGLVATANSGANTVSVFTVS
jgi:6-phosphogluconolactonase (cycloisomerase 2 family)